jgi:hypothetical protein
MVLNRNRTEKATFVKKSIETKHASLNEIFFLFFYQKARKVKKLYFFYSVTIFSFSYKYSICVLFNIYMDDLFYNFKIYLTFEKIKVNILF